MTPSPPESSISRGSDSPGEAEEAVGIVLEHRRAVRARHLEQAPAARLGERAAARVLERRDRVDEARARRPAERLVERVHVHALVCERNGLHLGAEAAQDLERAVVARGLHEHLDARLDVVARDEVEGLERAVRDHHALDGDVVPVGDPLAERRVAEGRAVVHGGGAVARERGLGALAELLEGQQVGARKSAGEGNLSHGTSLLRAPAERLVSRRAGMHLASDLASGNRRSSGYAAQGSIGHSHVRGGGGQPGCRGTASSTSTASTSSSSSSSSTSSKFPKFLRFRRHLRLRT